MMNVIEKELVKRIEAAGFEEITITMKVNGDQITITPCYYGKGTPKWEDIEWFLMDSQETNLCGGETISKVADTIARYEEHLEWDAKALRDLKAHIREHGDDSDWDFVSDYHKEIFGHRPHVSRSQVIAWAHSDSKGSARFYR